MAGTGKSTIARTIADSFAKENQLRASFFFSRGRGDLGHARKFFTTIAAQFAGKDPCLRNHISKAIAGNPQIIREGLGEQWKYLILQPIIKLDKSLLDPQTFAIVFDALDECEGEDDVQLILRLLPQLNVLKKVKVRIFVTSRPETAIRAGFRQMSKDTHRDFSLHDIDQLITQQDIFTFLSHGLEEIRNEYGIQQGWPGDRSIQLLAENARGLFIHAATACRFIRTSKYAITPEGRLDDLLQAPVNAKSPDGVLDRIYLQILEQSLMADCDDREREKMGEQFRAVVGSTVMLFDTMSSSSLTRFINYRDRDVLALLGNLYSILDVPESPDHPIQTIHPSFRDFLLSIDRCSAPVFWVDELKVHENLTMCCLRAMTHLKQDICDLKDPGFLSCNVPRDRIQNCLPAELQYACRYWIEHLLRSELKLRDDDQIHTFLRKHFLHWFEALSLIGRTPEAVLAIASLESRIPVSDTNIELNKSV